MHLQIIKNYHPKEDGNLSSLGAMMQTVQEENSSSIRLIFKKYYFKQEENLSSLSARIWTTKEGKCSWCDLRVEEEPFIAPCRHCARIGKSLPGGDSPERQFP